MAGGADFESKLGTLFCAVDGGMNWERVDLGFQPTKLLKEGIMLKKMITDRGDMIGFVVGALVGWFVGGFIGNAIVEGTGGIVGFMVGGVVGAILGASLGGIFIGKRAR